MDWSLLALLAQDASEAAPVAATEPQWVASIRMVAMLIGMIALVAVVPYYICRLILTDALKLPKDFATRGAVILGCVMLAVIVLWPTDIWPKGLKSKGWPPKLNIDLKGGSILIYELEDQGEEGSNVTTTDLVTPIRNRIDPGGLNEIVIRARGGRQLEIIIPDKNSDEVERIKDLISTAGNLNFMLLADRANEGNLIQRALEPSQLGKKRIFASDTAEKEASVPIAEGQNPDDRTRPLGLWARVDREIESPLVTRDLTGPDNQPITKIVPLRVNINSGIYRNAVTGQILSGMDDNARREFPGDLPTRDRPGYYIEKYLAKHGITEVDVLLTASVKPNGPPARPVLGDGGKIVNASSGYGTKGPEVRFRLNDRAGNRMNALTSANLSQGNSSRFLAMVLDDVVLSAPAIQGTITKDGQVSGKFTQKDVSFLVDILKGGSLPATLNKVPISEDNISPLLGWDTILDSALAMAVSLGLVLVFMMVYYRFAGIVSAIALLLNLVFVLATMILIGAAFSLPGMAGLVLTVGMSVDANVLIFERIREELERGASLRLAIRNGFSRATGTIVDSNVTTLITAIVLYAFGSEQIRGFSVTLVLGILVSMFTAIFCSRLMFDVAERKGWKRNLGMTRIPIPNIDFVKLQKPVFVASMVLVLAGIVGVVYRNRNMLDIDFLGGSSVQVLLEDEMPFSDVRTRVDEGVKDIEHPERDSRVTAKPIAIEVTGVDEQNKPLTGRVIKIDSSFTDVAEFKQELLRIFMDDKGKPGGLLAHYTMTYKPDAIRPATVTGPAAVKVPGTGALDGPEVLETIRGGSTEPPILRSDNTKAIVPADTEGAKDSAEAEVNGDSDRAIPGKGSGADTDPGGDPKVDPLDKAPISNPGGGSIPLAPDDASSSWIPRWTAPTALLASTMLWQEGTAPDDSPKVDKPAETVPANDKPTEPGADDSPAEPAKPIPITKPDASPTADPADKPSAVDPDVTAGGELKAAIEPPQPDVTAKDWNEVSLTFAHEISRPSLRLQVEKAAEQEGVALLESEVRLLPMANPAKAGDATEVNAEQIKLAGWATTPDSELAFNVWSVTMRKDAAEMKKVLDRLQQNFSNEVFWPASSQIGAEVAGETQGVAFGALLASIVGIVLYIWFRFQRVVFGLAAVVALVHDVLITLGAVAATYFLADYLGFLQIEEFKINLPMIAAFLTIIGYSINDTIVIFDRIREVKGKSPHITRDIINRSINGTLSRTLLTSLTTFMVAVVLYFAGGQGIHGFAFAIVIGVAVGTYSSIFIAAPLLLWMTAKDRVAAGTVPTKG